MALSFQIDVTKYAAPGETKTLLVQERDKAGRLLGQELVTMSRLQGIPDIVSSGSGYIHEIPISERAYNAIKAIGEFPFIEYQPAPDPPITGVTPLTPKAWLIAQGFGVAPWLTEAQILQTATKLGYTGK